MVVLNSGWIFSTQTIRNRTQIQIDTDYTFFGVTFKYRENLLDQIFDFVYYSEGAFNFDEVRSWPIWLRNHYINKLSKILKKQNEEIKKSNNRARRR